jgi:hypothetical protein
MEAIVVLLVGFEVIVGEIRHRAARGAPMTAPAPTTEPGVLLPRRIGIRLGLFIILVSGALWTIVYLTYRAAPSAPQGFGFAEATMPPKADPIGSTFSIQLAQLLHGLHQPCLFKITNTSKSELGGVIYWVLSYGNIPSGPLCAFLPNNPLPNADIPLIKPTTDPGIIVHWKISNPDGEKVAHFLEAMGANVHISRQLDGDAPDHLIWIDIGPGSPWKRP